MNCKNCQIEYKPLRKTSFFCSDKCRASFNRKIANGELANANSEREVSVTSDTINHWGKDVREMDAETLYAYIGAYPNDTWKDSPEFRELTKQLEKPVKWLRANGYWLPNRLEKTKV